MNYPHIIIGRSIVSLDYSLNSKQRSDYHYQQLILYHFNDNQYLSIFDKCILEVDKKQVNK
jgi:hypothetical protein